MMSMNSMSRQQRDQAGIRVYRITGMDTISNEITLETTLPSGRKDTQTALISSTYGLKKGTCIDAARLRTGSAGSLFRIYGLTAPEFLQEGKK